MGFGVFFFIGTVDRRLYRSLQLRNRRGVHCLGVLPDLSRGQLDPESSAAAAYCVHQIRNHIEAVRRPGPGFVLAITSPIPGQGKTSVTTALGWSYAAAGYRTVLVDCDMAVGSLSRQLGLADQPGLKEALRDGTCNGQTCVLSCPNLTVLPAGTDPLVGAEAIRKRDIEAVLEHLRRDFDVVLVDTGPMPVSLESLPVAAAADGVVIVCRRGARRSRLEECLEFLSEAGAFCVGIVLNCAARADCDRYVSSSSLSAPRRKPDDSSRAARELGANDGGNALAYAMRVAADQERKK